MSWRAKAYLVFILAISQLIVIAPANAIPTIMTVDFVALDWKQAPAKKVSIQNVQEEFNLKVINTWAEVGGYEQNSSRPRVVLQEGVVETSPISLSQAPLCNSPGITNLMVDLRRFYYSKPTQNLGNRILVALIPNANCIWEGISLLKSKEGLPGVVLLQDTSSWFVLSHEIGHALGLGHTNLLRCANGNVDDRWSEVCMGVEYGGAIDIMSNVPREELLSTYHSWRLGFLKQENIYQSWKNEDVLLNTPDTASGYKVIFLKFGHQVYWIEYRNKWKTEAYREGLIVYRIDPPPSSYIQSPNPQLENNLINTFEISNDVWLLNADDFAYTGRSTRGSPVLPLGKKLTIANGTLSILATDASGNGSVKVTISRDKDQQAPPVITLPSDPDFFTGSNSLVSGLYEDEESYVDYFEIERDGEVRVLPQRTDATSLGTYLYPFQPRRTASTLDLPEGRYALRIRSVDYWGNKSSWSNKIEVDIDRSFPVVTNEGIVTKVDGQANRVRVQLLGAKDEGSSLCESALINSFGFKTQNVITQEKPTFEFDLNAKQNQRMTLMDCRGNATEMKIETFIRSINLEKTKRTGKWNFGKPVNQVGTATCEKSCSISLVTNLPYTVIVRSGQGRVTFDGKLMSQFNVRESNGSRFIQIPSSSNGRKKLLRVQGNQLSIEAITENKVEVLDLANQIYPARQPDSSLITETQRNLDRIGFNQSDFFPKNPLQLLARGNSLEEPTLDLCKSVYTSDQAREIRRQVQVLGQQSEVTFFSTEIVRYKNRESALEARNELQMTVNKCKKESGFRTPNGLQIPYEFLNDVTESNGVDSSNITLHVKIGNLSESRILLASYTFKGEYLQGVYLVKSGLNPFMPEQIHEFEKMSVSLMKRIP